MTSFNCMAGHEVFSTTHFLLLLVQLVHFMYIPASVEVIRKRNALCAHVQQARLVTVASQ